MVHHHDTERFNSLIIMYNFSYWKIWKKCQSTSVSRHNGGRGHRKEWERRTRFHGMKSQWMWLVGGCDWMGAAG